MKRTSLRLLDHEDRLLKDLYLKYGVPIDQYEKRPADRLKLVRDWNESSERSDNADSIMHYMKTRRKRGLWVRFDGNHKTAPKMTVKLLPEEEKTLIDAYFTAVVSSGSASDRLSCDTPAVKRLANEFAKLTGRRLPGHVLMSHLTAMRKDGRLPKSGLRKLPFDDTDEVRE